MLRRKTTAQLEEWRHQHGQECLLVKGARQVGKTYTITQFGMQAYESFIPMNFIESPELKAVFSGDLASSEIKKDRKSVV